jgi:hypothetical protein
MQGAWVSSSVNICTCSSGFYQMRLKTSSTEFWPSLHEHEAIAASPPHPCTSVHYCRCWGNNWYYQLGYSLQSIYTRTSYGLRAGQSVLGQWWEYVTRPVLGWIQLASPVSTASVNASVTRPTCDLSLAVSAWRLRVCVFWHSDLLAHAGLVLGRRCRRRLYHDGM